MTDQIMTRRRPGTAVADAAQDDVRSLREDRQGRCGGSGVAR